MEHSQSLSSTGIQVLFLLLRRCLKTRNAWIKNSDIRTEFDTYWIPFGFDPTPWGGGERKKNDTINHQASICRPVVQLFTPRKFVDNNKAMFYLLTNLFLSRPLLLQNPPKQVPKVGPNPCSGPDVVLSRVEVETTNEAWNDKNDNNDDDEDRIAGPAVAGGVGRPAAPRVGRTMWPIAGRVRREQIPRRWAIPVAHLRQPGQVRAGRVVHKWVPLIFFFFFVTMSMVHIQI